MLLAQAIRKNARSLAQAQTSYKTNVVSVATMIGSVLNSSLPVLSQNPPHWEDAVTTYETANTTALQWVNDVYASLYDVPGDVQGYNTVVNDLLQDAAKQANALVSNPNDAIALAMLNEDLSNLSSQFALVNVFITGAISKIQSFTGNLPGLATSLQTVAADATAASGADQTQVTNLNSAVMSLNADIKKLNDQIIGLAVADGLAVVGIVGSLGIGAIFFGAAIATASTYIQLDKNTITADKALVETDKTDITQITDDIGKLNVCTNVFASMATASQPIESALAAILAEWQALETDVNTAIADIAKATSDATAAKFGAVATDIANSLTEWNAAYSQAGSLNIDVQVSTVAVTVGMSSNQVKATIQPATTMGFVAYCNQIT